MEALVYFFEALPFVLAMLFAVLTALAIVVVGTRMTKSPVVGLFLFGAAFFQAMLLPGLPALPIGVSLYFGDIVCISFVVCAGLRFSSRRVLSRFPRTLLPFALVLLLSFILGTVEYKTASGVAFRAYFYCFALAMYLGSFDYLTELLRPAIKCLGFIGMIIMAIAVLRWLDVLPHGAETGAPNGAFSTLDRIRSVDSISALLLSQSALVLLVPGLPSGIFARLRFLVPLLLSMVLVLQHRSVWIATLAALAIHIVLIGRGKVNSLYIIGALAFATVGGIALITTDIGSTVSNQVATSAERALSGSDSGQARLEAWSFVLEKYRNGGPKAWLIGFPFGTSMDRYTVASGGELRMVSFQAHNFFVQTLFNAGIVGVVSVLWMLAWLARRITKLMKDAAAPKPYAMLLILLVGQIFYLCFYSMTIATGLLFGLMFSACYGSRSKEAPKPKVWAPYAGRSNQSWVAK